MQISLLAKGASKSFSWKYVGETAFSYCRVFIQLGLCVKTQVGAMFYSNHQRNILRTNIDLELALFVFILCFFIKQTFV